MLRFTYAIKLTPERGTEAMSSPAAIFRKPLPRARLPMKIAEAEERSRQRLNAGSRMG